MSVLLGALGGAMLGATGMGVYLVNHRNPFLKGGK